MKVKYLSENRPGKFKKTISVSTNIGNEVIKLVVKGNVVGTPGKLRKRIGFLNSDTNRIDFKDLHYPSKVKQVVEIENPTKVNIELNVLSSPEYISIKINPKTLKPEERGKITVTYNSKKKEKYGSSTDHIKLNIKRGKKETVGTITVVADMVQDFSKLTEQELADAPVIYFPKRRLDLGLFEPNETRNAEFLFKNNGKTDLILHNVEISNKFYKLQPYDPIVEPGEEGRIILTFKPVKPSTNMKTNILIISNDPKNSKVNLLVQGTMKKIESPAQSYNSKGLSIHEKEVYEMLKKFKGTEKLVIIDLRSEEEFKQSHLPDAINIEFNNFKKFSGILAKDRIYILYSNSENESIKIAKMMQENKFEMVRYLEKGIIGWKKSGLPLEK